jgi:DNA-directed RNA polymerase subunit RPC12/RpoP
MATSYVCDHCGYEGSDEESPPVDEIQCPMCGEPVTPLG